MWWQTVILRKDFKGLFIYLPIYYYNSPSVHKYTTVTQQKHLAIVRFFLKRNTLKCSNEENKTISSSICN